MATANDGISRFSASTSYATPTFTTGVTTPIISSPAGESVDIISDTGFVLSGSQGNMDQLVAADTILPSAPMPFLGAFYFTGAFDLTLPPTWYPATRLIIKGLTGAVIQRPAGATYTINGTTNFTFAVDGSVLLFSIDTNQYGTLGPA